ncbi:Rrf2 family transcriptional regulator [Pseudonocardia endophytica]|uniref:BadM/Rrf2 family transcriptional regulator n=1 Tax=Pseudonocardia endophytica TaxID=401976 RepID=A0A4R1HFP2_PSEEN|nr:Rrf2 family transcriptional regulator [Pseudonocardia endophytica]TCK20947.1 BadM/Rrf2 family transcriptional regulator [Pseudonocardia endophytica]
MTAVPAPTTGPAATVHTPPAASRGTVVVLAGRGEHARVYDRLGRRLAVDGYTVVVPGTMEPDREPDGIRAAFTAHPDGARVLLGADRGAVRAWAHAAARPDGVDALVLAGLPLAAGQGDPGDREGELDLRTQCPVHRALLADDPAFGWGALDQALPARPAALPDVPTLLLHGAADRVAPLAPVRELARAAPQAALAVVEGGVHDVLNDRFHRSVAARLVLFVEEIGKGARIVDDPNGAADPAAAVPQAQPARGRSRRAAPLHVSARLDYALRTVAALPADARAEPVRCESVARTRGIPLNSLVNIMVDLRRAGLVRSRRGCEGGYWLARPAAEITVADVVRAVESEVAAVPDGPGTEVWHDLGRAVTDFLEHRVLDHAPDPLEDP